MELPDEAIAYQYQTLLVPREEEWTAAAELRARHFLDPARIKELTPRLSQARGQVAAEREVRNVPVEDAPLHPGFIDLPQQTLDGFRRRGEASELGQVLDRAARLRDDADRVIVIATGGSQLGARALVEALRPAYHNELPPERRLGVPRLYFEGNHFDNDSLQDLLDLIQESCVDPERREERWAVVVVSKSGASLETAAALRVFRRDAAEYYGTRSAWLKELFVPVAGPDGALRDLFRADGYADEEILTIPENVGTRYSVFTAAGLLPAAVMGLDVRALLQGAASMTKRFLEEPFERNPVLQFAAVNYLMAVEKGNALRVLAVWSKKLAALGLWYEQLVAEGLGKRGRGPTPLTLAQTRDLHARGQHLQDGPRDRLINNLVVKDPRAVPINVQMADRNEDGLNQFARKGLPDLTAAALRGANLAYWDVARPTADLVVPTLNEHTMGQLMQLLMLATVIEGKLLDVNPYSQPGAEVYRRHMLEILKSQ